MPSSVRRLGRRVLATPTALFATAAIARATLIVYGAWHDDHAEVAYTDVDYKVFSHGARLVAKRQSPFSAPGYRYTPLLALALAPNESIGKIWGKCLFATADLVVGFLLHRILQARGVKRQPALRCVALWLLNPLVANVSTRGNAESLHLVALVGALDALTRRRVEASAALLALAAHLKPYVIIYLPAFVLALNPDFHRPLPRGLLEVRTGLRRAVYVASFGIWSAALVGGCFAWCGLDYIQEGLLFHVSRADAAHNFSVYFYPLDIAPPAVRAALAACAFVPQASSSHSIVSK